MSFPDTVDVKDNCKNPYVASLSNVGYIVVLRCFARYYADWKHVILGPLKHGRASLVFRHTDQRGHSSAPSPSTPSHTYHLSILSNIQNPGYSLPVSPTLF